MKMAYLLYKCRLCGQNFISDAQTIHGEPTRKMHPAIVLSRATYDGSYLTTNHYPCQNDYSLIGIGDLVAARANDSWREKHDPQFQPKE